MPRNLASILLLTIATCVGPPANAQLRLTNRYAVTQSEVARAIMKALEGEVGLAMTQVQLLTDVLATQRSPLLDITALTPLPQQTSGRQQIAVRLVCHDAALCMPFYAIATVSPDTTLRDLAGNSPRPDRLKQTTTLLQPAVPARPLVILHSGDHVTLILDDGSAQLAVPVISLENAALGQSIRVATLDRKHIYTARTVTATLLRGSF